MIETDHLGDHPAHRRADNVRLLDPVGVEYRRAVGGHVVERVAVVIAAHRRQPGIAVVQSDHQESAVDERLTQLNGVRQ